MTLRELKNLYDIGTIPLWLRPLAHGLALLAAGPWLLWTLVVRWTSRVEIVGEPALLQERGVIFCHWHETIATGQLLFRYGHIALLFHPKWYMLPVYYLFRGLGCHQLVFGSTGHQGRSALDQLQRLMAEGYSTILNPDGPNGPAGRAKAGLYHLAKGAKAAVVPLRITVDRALPLRDWDRKLVPLPGCRVVVTVGPRLAPPAGDDPGEGKEAYLRQVEAHLGPPLSAASRPHP